jgi:UDP-N-acetylmuramoyl-tripeptide--D-alanyl-D-alanine ligase
MQLIHNTKSDVYVIDDSFNGNIEWVKSIIHLMKHSQFSGRKILVAGWVVELWDQSHNVNLELWKEISSAADMVLIVEWPVWNAIEEWLKKMNFWDPNIKKYASPLALHEDLKNITQRGDMIIFQNDLPDTYL